MRLGHQFPRAPGSGGALFVLFCALAAPAQRTPDTRLDTDPPGASASLYPQIAASGGSVYVTWEDWRSGAWQTADIHFNRSLDGGATWLTRDVRLNTGPVAATSRSQQPQIAASGSMVFVTWTDHRNGQEDIYFNRSTDGGMTWLSSDIRLNTDPPGAASSANPRIVAVGASVYVVWNDARNGLADLYFNHSLDGGVTWLPADVRVDNNPPGVQARQHQIAAVGASVYVTWEHWITGGQEDIYFNRSVDGGLTWLGSTRLNTDPPASSPKEGPRIAASGSTVWVGWQDSRNSLWATDVYHNLSVDGGATWLGDARLNTNPLGASPAGEPRVASSGSWVYVMWWDFARVPGGGAFLNRSANGGRTWLASEVQIPSLQAAQPNIAAAGSSVFVGGPLEFTRSLDAGASWLATPTRITAAPNAKPVDPQLTASGSRVYATWSDYRNGAWQSGNDIYFNVPFGLLPYGSQTAGSAGVFPSLAGTGRATLGDQVSLDTTGGIGAAPAWLLVGGGPATKIALPLLGGTLLVAPTVALPFGLGGATGVPGAGSASIPLVLPSTPSALGANVNFQSLILDSGAPQGVSMTNGVELWIG